jgi:hypothetical protein
VLGKGSWYRNFFSLAEIDFISPPIPSARSLNFRYYTVYGLDFILSLVLSDLMIEWGSFYGCPSWR